MQDANNQQRTFILNSTTEQAIEALDVTDNMRKDYTSKAVCVQVVTTDSKGNVVEIAQGKNGLTVAFYSEHITKTYQGLSLLDAIRKLQSLTNNSFATIEHSLYFGDELADLTGNYAIAKPTNPVAWTGLAWN